MPSYLSPRIDVQEIPPAIRTIEGVPTSVGGLVGIAKKGPIGKATAVSGLEDFVEKFGGPIPQALLYWVVKGFYDVVGTGLMWIVRTAHYTDITDASTLTATKSARTIKDRLGSVDTLTVRSKSEGTWANSLQISTALSSQFSTTLNNGSAVANGATSCIVTSTAGMHRGTVLELSDVDDSTIVVVDRVENNRIYFQSAISDLASATIADGGAVTQLAFDLFVYQSDELVESWPFLSMEDTDAVNYAEKRINGFSRWIEVEDEDTSNGAGEDRPATLTKQFLTGGTDGLGSLASGDFIGNAASKTGLRAFDSVEFLNMVGVPESQSSAVQSAILDYADLRDWTFGVLNSPLGLDEAGIIEYVTDTLAANTSRSAMYYKQVTVYDPTTDGAKIVPADGHIMGIYARTDDNFGVSQVGAGDLGLIPGIIGLENDYAESEPMRDLIYPERINPLVNHPAIGRCIFGSRTLDRTNGIGSQINERRTFMFIGQSLHQGMHFVLFKNNTPEFRKTVRDTMDAFLAPLKRAGILLEYYIDVSDNLNNALIQAQGRLIARVGLQVPNTIEFFDIQLTRDIRAQEAALAAQQQ